MLQRLLPLWCLVSLLSIVHCESEEVVPEPPQPTDCTGNHDNHEYCGVIFYCKCVWQPPTMLEALEGCGLNVPCSISVDNEIHPVWFPASSISPASAAIELNDVDDESNNDNQQLFLSKRDDNDHENEQAIPVGVGAKSKGESDANQFIRLFYHVDDENNKAFTPEDLDAEGCGVPDGEGATSLRVATIEGVDGVQYMPPNIASLLKSIHGRTRGRCSFRNRSSQGRPKKCKRKELNPIANSTEDQEGKIFAIRVELHDVGMAETVINTVRQEHAAKYNSKKDYCFKTTDDQEIVCLL